MELGIISTTCSLHQLITGEKGTIFDTSNLISSFVNKHKMMTSLLVKGSHMDTTNLARDVLKMIVLVMILIFLFSAFLIIGDFDNQMSQRKAVLMKRLQKSQRELVK